MSVASSRQKLEDALAYVCEKYPHKPELSKARVTKMIYLADWKSCLQYGSQISSIDWKFNHYGPYVDDATDVARSSTLLHLVETENMYGRAKTLISRSDAPFDPEQSSLTPQDVWCLDTVIEETKRLYWSDFISLVYGTYPVKTQPRLSILDLPKLADEAQRN